MLTVYECALLSEAAYSGNSLRPVQARGFRAYSQRGSGRGFFGRTFCRGNDVVVAFAGTDDPQDALDDLEFTRRIPEDQARQAGQYFGDMARRIGVTDTTFVVTGHSLGGGLAKHVLLENSAVNAAVAFNSPFVGGLEDVNRSMGTLLNVNSRGDPVSGLTRSIIGTFEIGETMVQEISPFQRSRLRQFLASGTGVGGLLAEEAWSQAERQSHLHSIAALRAALATGELGRRSVP